MSAKHTPGPWFDSTTPSGKGKVVDANGFSICNTTSGPYEQQRKDARLIAAAARYKQGMDRFYVLLGLCSTDEQVDDALDLERQIEREFLRAYWEATKAFNSLEDCMRSNARKIYRLVAGVAYAPAE